MTAPESGVQEKAWMTSRSLVEARPGQSPQATVWTPARPAAKVGDTSGWNKPGSSPGEGFARHNGRTERPTGPPSPLRNLRVYQGSPGSLSIGLVYPYAQLRSFHAA